MIVEISRDAKAKASLITAGAMRSCGPSVVKLLKQSEHSVIGVVSESVENQQFFIARVIGCGVSASVSAASVCKVKQKTKWLE